MLIRQTLLYLPAQIIGPLVQFASILLWTHYLSPTEMGLFALVLAAQELIYTTALFWYSIYTIRYFDQSADPDVKEQFLATEAMAILLATVAAIVTMGLFPLLFGDEWGWPLLTASAVFIVGRAVGAQLSERARMTADMTSYSILQIVWPLAGLILAWLLVSNYGATATHVIAGYAAGQWLSTILVVGRMAWPKSLASSREIVKAALKYSVPLVIGAQLVWIANNGIRFIIEYMDGIAAVGLLTIGWALGLRVANFVALLVTAAGFPLAIRKLREEGIDAGQQQLVRNGMLLLFVMAPAMVGFWLISPALVELLVAEQYRALTTEILPWAILAGAARNLRVHFGEQVFLLREEPKIPLFNDALDGVATLIGAIAGFMWGGLVPAVIGAALGAVVALVVTAGFGLIMHRFVLPFGEIVRIGIATAAMASAVFALGVQANYLSVTLAVFIGALVYAIASALLYPEMTANVSRQFRTLTRHER